MITTKSCFYLEKSIGAAAAASKQCIAVTKTLEKTFEKDRMGLNK